MYIYSVWSLKKQIRLSRAGLDHVHQSSELQLTYVHEEIKKKLNMQNVT